MSRPIHTGTLSADIDTTPGNLPKMINQRLQLRSSRHQQRFTVQLGGQFLVGSSHALSVAPTADRPCETGQETVQDEMKRVLRRAV